MHLVCSDLEGVFVPEIWINVAERTGIPELRLTTRDIADYDELMRRRLAILRQHRLTLADIQAAIAAMQPLPGALAFLDWLRARTQVIVVSDTYVEFAAPLMAQLGYPTLLCHCLEVDTAGTITDYRLRQREAKRHTVEALRGLNYRVVAMGDSYNDIRMLQSADAGILFRPPANVRQEFPNFPVAEGYDALKPLLLEALADPSLRP
jgi:phosphoserine/homoserine phosphotransferase